MRMKKEIYLDYAGATPVDPRVKRVVLDCMDEFGNASSVHLAGRRAKEIIDESRKKISGILGSRPEEVIFTGSGTESDNLAIFGVARVYKKSGKHMVTSKIEHPAVLRVCRYLEEHEGFKVSYLDVKKNGVIDPVAVANALTPGTVLVSIMYANNEIGTIQPIEKISRIIKKFKNDKMIPLFHSDACQAAGSLDLDVKKLGVDLMTLNGSKIYGPKGVGCLYVRKGVSLTPIIFGGDQENGLRAGTENITAIAGFAKALELADREKSKENARLSKLRDLIIDSILETIPGSHLNGDRIQRLPNNINISFGGIDGEMLVLILDQEGIQVSTGSACTAGSTGYSHVLKGIGLSDKLAKGSIRITLGRITTKKEAKALLNILPQAIKKLA